MIIQFSNTERSSVDVFPYIHAQRFPNIFIVHTCQLKTLLLLYNNLYTCITLCWYACNKTEKRNKKWALKIEDTFQCFFFLCLSGPIWTLLQRPRLWLSLSGEPSLLFAFPILLSGTGSQVPKIKLNDDFSLLYTHSAPKRAPCQATVQILSQSIIQFCTCSFGENYGEQNTNLATPNFLLASSPFPQDCNDHVERKQKMKRKRNK